MKTQPAAVFTSFAACASVKLLSPVWTAYSHGHENVTVII